MFKIPKTIEKDGHVFRLRSMSTSGTGAETEYRLTYTHGTEELCFEGREQDVARDIKELET